jgi:uncharacterized CHY-type Zn-finger protein
MRNINNPQTCVNCHDTWLQLIHEEIIKEDNKSVACKMVWICAMCNTEMTIQSPMQYVK